MSVPTYYVCAHLLCLSSPIMYVLTYNVCPQLLCLSPPIMSIATLGSNLDSESRLCSEEPEWDLKSLLTNPPTHSAPQFFMSVPMYYVCPQLLCMSPPSMSVPIYYVCPHLFATLGSNLDSESKLSSVESQSGI